MLILVTVFIFLLGIASGSFINVIVDRLYKGESIIFKRSYCDSCGKTLLWFDLFPLLSFVLLRGRCRYCQKHISWQYPLVELASGLLFVIFFFWRFSVLNGNFQLKQILEVIFYFITASGLLIVFVADLKYSVVYDLVLYFLIAASLLQIVIFNLAGLLPALVAASISALLFLSLVLLTAGRGMGEGDIKLAFWLGLLTSSPNFLVLLVLSFTIGGIVALLLLISGRKKFGQTIPFAPFLVISALVTLFFGDRLLELYFKIFLT